MGRMELTRYKRRRRPSAKVLKHSAMPKLYSERTDLERLQSSWRKLQGLMSRGEWSAAITRTATAAEIAANIAVRHELEVQRKLEASFVDQLLMWANGLAGNLVKLLQPLWQYRQ
jgi:hypothetical protein